MLSNLFEILNYKVKVHSNFSSQEISKKIDKYSGSKTHNDYDSFICVFLSHGGRRDVNNRFENHIQTKDSFIHLEKDVLDKFNGERCNSLIGKPKIFIIQVTFY